MGEEFYTMDYPERQRIRQAAHLAKVMYPGPVGEILYKELEAFLDWGYRTFQGGTHIRLVDHIMENHSPE